MPLFKLTEGGVIFRKRLENETESQYNQTAVKKIMGKGELVYVDRVEDYTELGIKFKKYFLTGGDYMLDVKMENVDSTIKPADIVTDTPEYLATKLKQPKVYWAIGILLFGLAAWAIVSEKSEE